MAKEFHLVKDGFGFKVPDNQEDRDAASVYQTGDMIRVKAQKPRNPAHHRKGMLLLTIAFDYWEPEQSVLSSGEVYMAKTIADRLEALAGNSGAIREKIAGIVGIIENSRKARIGEPAKSFDAFRKDVVKKAGHYNFVVTPNGLEKEAKSLSFSSMPQEEFNQVYKDIFSACWDLVLSQHFESEAEAENAVNMMLDFA